MFAHLHDPRAENRLHLAAAAAGSTLACVHESSAELHAEAVRKWRASQPKPASIGFHAICVACVA
ncbi:MAG: hypothetical protein Q7T73_16650, partial [Beijerinckiaceae bacterium]|nr:hypothetical protein [Beijerinckiaceae bacterium]